MQPNSGVPSWLQSSNQPQRPGSAFAFKPPVRPGATAESTTTPSASNNTPSTTSTTSTTSSPSWLSKNDNTSQPQSKPFGVSQFSSSSTASPSPSSLSGASWLSKNDSNNINPFKSATPSESGSTASWLKTDALPVTNNKSPSTSPFSTLSSGSGASWLKTDTPPVTNNKPPSTSPFNTLSSGSGASWLKNDAPQNNSNKPFGTSPSPSPFNTVSRGTGASWLAKDDSPPQMNATKPFTSSPASSPFSSLSRETGASWLKKEETVPKASPLAASPSSTSTSAWLEPTTPKNKSLPSTSPLGSTNSMKSWLKDELVQSGDKSTPLVPSTSGSSVPQWLNEPTTPQAKSVPSVSPFAASSSSSSTPAWLSKNEPVPPKTPKSVPPTSPFASSNKSAPSWLAKEDKQEGALYCRCSFADGSLDTRTTDSTKQASPFESLLQSQPKPQNSQPTANTTGAAANPLKPNFLLGKKDATAPAPSVAPTAPQISVPTVPQTSKPSWLSETPPSPSATTSLSSAQVSPFASNKPAAPTKPMWLEKQNQESTPSTSDTSETPSKSSLEKSLSTGKGNLEKSPSTGQVNLEKSPSTGKGYLEKSLSTGKENKEGITTTEKVEPTPEPVVDTPSKPVETAPTEQSKDATKDNEKVSKEESQKDKGTGEETPFGEIGLSKRERLKASLANKPWKNRRGKGKIKAKELIEENKEEEKKEEEAVVAPESPKDGKSRHVVICGVVPKHQFFFNWGSSAPSKSKQRKAKKKQQTSNTIENDGVLPADDDIPDIGEEEEEEEEEEERGMPEELMKKIFSYLPPKDIASSRLVCTQWKALLEDLWQDLLNRRPQIEAEIEERKRQRELADTQLHKTRGRDDFSDDEDGPTKKNLSGDSKAGLTAQQPESDEEEEEEPSPAGLAKRIASSITKLALLCKEELPKTTDGAKKQILAQCRASLDDLGMKIFEFTNIAFEESSSDSVPSIENIQRLSQMLVQIQEDARKIKEALPATTIVKTYTQDIDSAVNKMQALLNELRDEIKPDLILEADPDPDDMDFDELQAMEADLKRQSGKYDDAEEEEGEGLPKEPIVIKSSIDTDKIQRILDVGVASEVDNTTNSIISTVIQNIMKRVDINRAGAAKCKDTQIRRQILDTCSELELLIEPIIECMRAVFADPLDKEAQENLSDMLDKVCELCDKLDSLVPNNLDSDLEFLRSNLDGALKLLFDAVQSSEEAKKQAILEQSKPDAQNAPASLQAHERDDDDDDDEAGLKAAKHMDLDPFVGARQEYDDVDDRPDLEYDEEVDGAIPDFFNLFDFEFLNSSIFDSDFFKLEIARLKTKYEYDNERRITGDIRPKQKVYKPKTTSELIKVAEREEVYATHFASKGEFEWSRILIQHAMDIRFKILNTYLKADKNTYFEDIQRQQFQIEKDWEKFIFLCLKGQPTSDTSEAGVEKTLELLETAFKLCPQNMRDARYPQFINLWESKVTYSLKLYEIVYQRQGAVDRILHTYITPLLKDIPFYLDRNNRTLDHLWKSVFAIHQAIGSLFVQHNAQSFKDYLLSLHQFFHQRIAEDDSLPFPISDAFPLFPDVCRALSNIYINANDYSNAQQFAVEEMMLHLEMDEENQNNALILDCWARIFHCIKETNAKSSDQFFLLKEVLQEVSVYNNTALKNQIQLDMNSVGNKKEVIYGEHYDSQLQKCAQVFFGEIYDEISQKLDNSSMLEEILSNLSSFTGSKEYLFNELRKLADLNYDFQFEMMKSKDYHRAKKIIEENLLIRKYTDPPILSDEGVELDAKTYTSYQLLIECTVLLVQRVTKSPVAIHLLTQCYDHRPLFYPYGNEKMNHLWFECIQVKEFYKETLESMYKKFGTDMKKLHETRILSQLQQAERQGSVVMRVNKTWQKRHLVLQDEVLHIFKNEKSLRSRGIIQLRDAEIQPIDDADPIVKLIPGDMRDNCIAIVTPYRGYILYTESVEEKQYWVDAIQQRKAALSSRSIHQLETEIAIRKELLARHPLILDALLALGNLWEQQEYSEEALILYAQGLELAAVSNNTVDFTKSFWSTIYALLLKTKNIYEILEFLEEERDRWRAYGLSDNHLLLSLIEQSLLKITTEEDLKLRYMYQIRKYKELNEDIIPARIYYLNKLYSMKFIETGSLSEAISLTQDSLDLLKNHLNSTSQVDDMVMYYHMSTWYQLVDLYIMSAREKEKQRDYFGGRLLLQDAFQNHPNKLDPFNPSLNKLLDEIYRIYNTDPDTKPHAGTAIVDTEAFHWMYSLYLHYDDELAAVYPSEALANKSTMLNYKKLVDRDTLEKRKEDFRVLIKKYPEMMNICTKMGQSYYVAHQLENALHMARHTLHITIASMPNRHNEIAEQWKLCKKYFLAQRHSNQEIKTFIEEEKLFASVFLSDRHPHTIRVNQDLKKLASKMALYEKYIPAAAFYGIYMLIFGSVVYYLSVNPTAWLDFLEWFSDTTSIWLLCIALYLDLGLMFTAIIFVTWPPLPSDTLHRTAVLLKRKKILKNVALMIACHNSGEVLPQTLRAALRIFPPDHIYVCDNGNSPKPTDNSPEVVEKISQEYQIQHGLPPDSPKINYFYMTEGNKSLVFWYGAKYYCHYKYCFLIDDDVQLPPDLIIPMHKFKIPGTKVLAFTIAVENLHDHKGKIIYVSFWQDLEYKLAGFMKMFQSWVGSAIMAHGAISLWDRKTLMEVLWRHDTVFHGDDLQMGLILQKLDREYRIDTAGNVNVPTTVPDHMFCPTKPWTLRCVCPGKDGNLYGQRVRSWDVATHRFMGKFLTILLFHWNRTTNAIKPFILYELWSIFQDWFRIPMAFTLLVLNPVSFLEINLFFVVLAELLMIGFNFWVLRRRPDQQHPWRTLLPFPVYKMLTLIFRFIALWYNLFYYTPFIRNRQILGTRQDLPLGPQQVALIQELSKAEEKPAAAVTTKPTHDWDTIAKLINKDAQLSPPLSHWFLSCISKLRWKKDNPRDKILSHSHMKKSKKIIGRTERFFYSRTETLFQIIPITFYSCLNAMCFLSRKQRCLGRDTVKSGKILKWLWIEEKLGDQLGNSERVQSCLKEFAVQCEKGISMYQFVVLVREVIRPTLQFLDTSLHQIMTQILHLQLALEDGWVLKSLSLTSTDDRLIVRQYEPAFFKKALEANQPLAVFVPLPSSEDTGIEPFKPSIIHALLLFDPIEGTVIVCNPQEKSMDRVFAVLKLLEIENIPVFKAIYNMSVHTAAVKQVSLADVRSRAQRFFNDTKNIKRRFIAEATELPSQSIDFSRLLFRNEDKLKIKQNTISASGFWLLPVIDIISCPILFLDEDDKIIDREHYFDPYGKFLDLNHRISTNPLNALKDKVMQSATAKFLNNITQKRKSVQQHEVKFNVMVFRCSTTSDSMQEFKLLGLNENKQLQAIMIDFLAQTVAEKKNARLAALQAAAVFKARLTRTRNNAKLT